MSSQIVPIHRTNSSSSSTNKHDTWFNAFDFEPGQDEHIRWLSRPKQDVIHDAEKFRITFDVENFQPEQIKICIQNRQLTISGVYEERSEGHFMQKQFERTFDIPSNADVESMASFITSGHMLVVEVPIHSSNQIDHLNINQQLNNQRRLSFSLNKFNTSNKQDLSSSTSSLTTPGEQVRRTSITKTTTTTTTTGSKTLASEASKLLTNVDSTTGSTQTLTTSRSSNTSNQQIDIHQPNSSSSSLTTTSDKQTTLTCADLANLPIEIPPEMLASGGTVTIQKHKVSVTKGTDGHAEHGVSVPIQSNNDSHSTSSTTTNTSSQQQSSTSESRDSKTISNSNKSRMFTLEEFLLNKTWNPSVVDVTDGKKILHMRLQMKSGTTWDQMKISLNGHDLRIEVNNKISTDNGRFMSEHSYRQITLFPTCEVDQLKTELKDDGYLHIQVPIKL